MVRNNTARKNPSKSKPFTIKVGTTSKNPETADSNSSMCETIKFGTSDNDDDDEETSSDFSIADSMVVISANVARPKLNRLKVSYIN